MCVHVRTCMNVEICEISVEMCVHVRMYMHKCINV